MNGALPKNRISLYYETMQRVFLDLEYLYPGMTAESGRPTRKNRRQIVQIAAIAVDAHGREHRTLNVLTVPTYTKQLPPFFTRLTGITQRQVNREAIPLRVGLTQLRDFCGALPVWTFDKDYEVLQQIAGISIPRSDSKGSGGSNPSFGTSISIRPSIRAGRYTG